MRAFYRAHYAPNNAVLALAGDVDEAEARVLVERFFGPLQPREIPPAPDLAEPPLAATSRVIEDKFAKVPMLMAAWRAPERGSKDYWALTVLGEILGGGEDSPLYQTLVKDAKLALSASANFPWWTGPFNPGGPELFGLVAKLKPGAGAEAALEAVDLVLSKLVWSGPSPELLAAAKTSIEYAWTKDLEQLIARAKTLSSYAAMVGDPAGLAADFEALMSVTIADVQRAVNVWLMSKPRAVVEARPSPDLVLPADIPTPPMPEQRPRGPGETRPELDAQRPTAIPKLERFTLANGLKVIFARDRRLPLL